MQTSVKGLIILGLLIGQLIAASAQDITCPAAYVEGCDDWTWSNQAQWTSLCNQYATCGSGLQSPIDIPVSSLTCGSKCVRPQIVYSSTTGVNLFNIDQTLAAVPDTGSYVNYEGVRFDLKWIEFRQPSEHSLGGVFSDFESQFWHQSTDGQWLAIAVLYKIDANEDNVWFASFWNQIPQYSDCACGNGRIDSGEQCDDGPLNSNTIADRCRTNCKIPYCGDAVKDRTEECDLGSRNNDTASSTSTTDASKQCRTSCYVSWCGDGVVDLGEDCDDGNQNYGDGCTPYCVSECGNGKIDSGEQCDKGTTVNNQRLVDGCRPGCVNYYCGDGVKDTNEQCDTGASNSNTARNACRTNCRTAYCGDGVVDNGEACDPFNNTLCTSNCTVITPTCGNGRLDSGESCDAGVNNAYASARCRPDCTLPFCGDGVRDSGSLSTTTGTIVYNETCDIIGGTTTCNPRTCTNTCGDGNVDPNEECDLGGGVGTEPNHGNKPNQCRKGCIDYYCGDGIIDSNEECDLGASNGLNTTSCTKLCTFKYCGDGHLDNQVTDRNKESCDDGNTIDNDGCSSVCQIECGDGFVTGSEECDMGTSNANAPNKCKTNCKAPKCGDGYVDFNEECDYAAPGVGTTKCRTNCKLPYCGDGTVDSVYGEQCDAGFAGNSDISSTGCSTRCTLNTCSYVRATGTGDLNRAMACSGCFYSYVGSSTRPPCTGPVQWLVAQSVQKISQFQIDTFQHVFGTGVKRPQKGDCQLTDPYSSRACDCVSTMGSINTVARAACEAIPRKPALTTTLNILSAANSSGTAVLQQAIRTLVSLVVREPLILPTYIGGGTNTASIVACETEAFYNRGLTDLTDTVNLLRNVGNFNADVQPTALSALVFFEHVLQFYQSLQVLTAWRTPTGTLSNALALMIGSGAQSPFLPYDWNMQNPHKEMIQADVSANHSVLVQRTTSGLQARLFRSAIGFNTDPEIHRFSNIADQAVWSVRFVSVEYLKQYGYKGAADGSITFSLSDEKVILESNLLNLWNFNQPPTSA